MKFKSSNQRKAVMAKLNMARDNLSDLNKSTRIHTGRADNNIVLAQIELMKKVSVKPVIKKAMTADFALFNSHINNADKKALNDVNNRFGKKGTSTIAKFKEKGIMSIFKQEPTPITLFYVKQVKKYVNEGRE